MAWVLYYLVLPLGFLFIITLLQWLIFKAQSKSNPSHKSFPIEARHNSLEASHILQWEFDYIRTTASEAMRDRHTMINFYLLAVGIVASGVVALLKQDSGIPATAGTALLWGLCIIGLFYFLKIIRLRQAWHESATAMNRIKQVYIVNTEAKDSEILTDAFHWDVGSLPPANKQWNVFHYSAMLVGFVNSVAYVAGGVLVYLKKSSTCTPTEVFLSPWQWILLGLSGLGFFMMHDIFYRKFLKQHNSGSPMSKPSDASDDTSRWVKILDEVEDYRLGKLFRIIKATLKHRLLDGSMSEPITRINFERGDSVSVLLYHPKKDSVILVRQFRYPIYAGLRLESREGEGARDAWILETVAGIKEQGETILDVANRELLEEVGYRVKGALQLITTMYPSPGGSSERITLFLGKVDDVQREGTGGGVKAEGEDIEVVVVPFTKAMAMIENGEICDAKTIIALQYLALRAGALDSRTIKP